MCVLVRIGYDSECLLREGTLILWKFHSGLHGLIIAVCAATCNAWAKITSLQRTDAEEREGGRRKCQGRVGLKTVRHITEVYLQTWRSLCPLWLLSPTGDAHLYWRKYKIQRWLWHFMNCIIIEQDGSLMEHGAHIDTITARRAFFCRELEY